MDADVLLFSLGTAILLISLVAAYALGSWRAGSPATRPRKAPDSSEATSMETLRRRVESLEADQAALSSTSEKLCTTVKRLTSRHGMQEHREASSSARNPDRSSMTKVELMRSLGLAGKSGPAWAQRQLEIESERTN